MKFPTKKVAFAILCTLLISLSCDDEDRNVVQPQTDFNRNWKFTKGEVENAQDIDFDDTAWKSVKLPHDWSVEASYTQENASGATAFLPGGIGWYRKTFQMAKSASDKITRINFDGIYNNSEVWINGHHLGERPYGYIGFYYDLTPFLKYGDEPNVIAVKADRSAYLDCRWYPGSGIYRNVRLETLDKTHLTEWGTTITTSEVSEEKATVKVENEIVNQHDTPREILVQTIIIDANGSSVATQEHKLKLEAGETRKDVLQIPLPNPKLWDTKSPNLYALETKIIEKGDLLDTYTSTFGIRSIHYSVEEGFLLNGKKTLFKGVCLHQDGGLVGAAVPRGVWERRLRLLKEAGVNAIRTAHNPPSEEFLDLCDEIGFLVQDEIFDEWENPKDKRHNYNQQKAEAVTRGYTEHIGEWAEQDIKNMIRRDKNHPSIVMWSLGNEIEWTYPSYGKASGYWGDDDVDIVYYYDEPYLTQKEIKQRLVNEQPDKGDLVKMAQNLSGWAKEIDTTRPVTANLVLPSASFQSGYTDALDIVGLSYRQAVYDYVNRLYPEKFVLGTENWVQWHEWKAALENDNIHGVFLWTGIFYMGESRGWPKKGNSSGMLDFAAFKTPRYHLFKSLWNPDPHIYMSTVKLSDSEYELVGDKVLDVHRNEKYLSKWEWPNYNDHWNYTDDEATVVEVFTNCKEVELFLNEVSLGTQKLADNYDDKIMQWHVPFKAGKLVAKGLNEDGSNIEFVLRTADEFSKISIFSDKTEIKSDGNDVVHIEVELTDENGNPFRIEDQQVTFQINGNYRLLGVDNGASDNVQDIQSNTIKTANGKALLILQSLQEKGDVTIKAKTDGVESETLTVKVI